MTARSSTLFRGLWHLLILFLFFHIFWLLVYLLSFSPLLKPVLLHIYLKQSLINSVGFVAFSLTAFWIFPSLISKQKYIALVLVSLALIISLGYSQYLLQDWHPEPLYKPASTGKNQTSQVPLRQTIGAPVRAMFTILTYMLLGTGYAYMKDWFIKDRHARILEKEKLDAELKLLRYQLNPHFLFNTINDIYYLAIIRSDKTPDALLKISNLLRYVLDEKEHRVSLEKELDHLQQFIELHQFRFPDHVLCQQTHIDQDISSLQIAPLLLITFAENAFKHGEPGTTDHPVVLKVKLEHQILTYEVVNKVNYKNSKDATTGIGLNNLRRRLSLLYPDQHELSLQEEDGLYLAHLKIHLS
jgi:two-component system, LytTR family, sensor kinase